MQDSGTSVSKQEGSRRGKERERKRECREMQRKEEAKREERKQGGGRERKGRGKREKEADTLPMFFYCQCILMSSSQHDCTPPFLQTSIVTPAHTISLLSYEPSAYLNHIIRNYNLFLFSTIFLD